MLLRGAYVDIVAAVISNCILYTLSHTGLQLVGVKKATQKH